MYLQLKSAIRGLVPAQAFLAGRRRGIGRTCRGATAIIVATRWVLGELVMLAGGGGSAVEEGAASSLSWPFWIFRLQLRTEAVGLSEFFIFQLFLKKNHK